MFDGTQIHSKEEERIRDGYARRTSDDRYSLFSPGHLFMIQERERLTLKLLKKKGIAPLGGKKILEVGCGTGYWIRQFINWGAQPHNITGIDLLPDRVTQAKSLCPAAVRIESRSAVELNMEDSQFHIILQSLVFSSILDTKMKQKTATEMLRVLKQDGVILWYDFHINNPRNPDVRGIKKEEIFGLFPNCYIDLWRITLAPPLVRFLAPHSWLTCYLLNKARIFNTHYLGIIRRSPNHIS